MKEYKAYFNNQLLATRITEDLNMSLDEYEEIHFTIEIDEEENTINIEDGLLIYSLNEFIEIV